MSEKFLNKAIYVQESDEGVSLGFQLRIHSMLSGISQQLKKGRLVSGEKYSCTFAFSPFDVIAFSLVKLCKR